jgi:GTP cyclohydrolase I
MRVLATNNPVRPTLNRRRQRPTHDPALGRGGNRPRHVVSRSLQAQERMTQQIAHWLESQLKPRGVGVVLEAEHMCMRLRGVRTPGTMTVTSALRGALRDDALTRGEFLDLVR